MCGRYGEQFIIEEQQIVFCCCKEYSCNILCATIIFHPEQFTCPAQIFLLRKILSAAEHQMEAMQTCALLEHEQSEGLFFGDNLSGDVVQLFGFQSVHIHSHGGGHLFCPLQRAVGIGHTTIVHLYESALGGIVAPARLGEVLYLLFTVSQGEVFLSRGDGTRHLMAILICDKKTTHIFTIKYFSTN
ncbi:hypothetical protein [Segatella albensis]|uniref:hypothetical protein n=1 Tax=Segatella albensis TaxID=77768 RepID=UPI0012B66406|nr:hypothetical protein [Segatella albensis]